MGGGEWLGMGTGGKGLNTFNKINTNEHKVGGLFKMNRNKQQQRFNCLPCKPKLKLSRQNRNKLRCVAFNTGNKQDGEKYQGRPKAESGCTKPWPSLILAYLLALFG